MAVRRIFAVIGSDMPCASPSAKNKALSFIRYILMLFWGGITGVVLKIVEFKF